MAQGLHPSHNPGELKSPVLVKWDLRPNKMNVPPLSAYLLPLCPTSASA